MAELSLCVPQFSPGGETVLVDVTGTAVAAAASVSVTVVTVVVVVGEDPWSAQLIWMPSVVGLAGTVVVVVVAAGAFVATTLLYAALETTSVRRSTKATPAVTNMLFELRYVLFIRKASSDW